jgi:hypothetical protein
VKDLCVWLVGFVMMSAAIRCAYQIKKQDGTKPTLSTWIIFCTGTILSLTTYLVAEKHDLRSGILNTADVLATATIFLSVLLWGERGVRFKSFEKWYLGGAGCIVTYGIFSGDAWGSNLFTQGLITFGYLPTVQKLLTEKRNTESFSVWGLIVLAGLFALYPAMVNGNLLAVVYVLRSTISVLIVIAMMYFFELRSKRLPSQT